MSMLKAFVVIASIATSSVALASPAHLSDAQYVSAARCGGLIGSPALGRGDTSAIDAVLKSEGRSRMPIVADKADEARRDAVREAAHAGVQGRAALAAERDGVCQAWNRAGVTTSASIAAQPTGAN